MGRWGGREEERQRQRQNECLPGEEKERKKKKNVVVVCCERNNPTAVTRYHTRASSAEQVCLYCKQGFLIASRSRVLCILYSCILSDQTAERSASKRGVCVGEE